MGGSHNLVRLYIWFMAKRLGEALGVEEALKKIRNAVPKLRITRLQYVGYSYI